MSLLVRRADPVNAGGRAFAAALITAALLAGLALGLVGASAPVRVAGVTLAAAACWSGWLTIRRGDRPALVLMLVAGVALLALFARHLFASTPPFPYRSLQVAAVLAYGAIALAGLLRIIQWVDGIKGLLLGFSTAAALFVADTFLPSPPTVILPPRWDVSMLDHPRVGFRYRPNSTARNYYPDDPRGYFEHTTPLRDAWSLETHENSEASVTHSGEEPGRLRVEIERLGGDKTWQVKLQQSPLTLSHGTQYSLRFRARSTAPRPIGAAVGQARAPWRLLSGYSTFELGTEWTPFEMHFTASASEPHARIFLDVGATRDPVDVADVVLAEAGSGRTVTPDTRPVEHFVSYRFNSLGFRGPDYAIPRPPGTFRIVALGDSYVLGVGVHERDTFSAQLERLLNASDTTGGPRYEVINAGVSGYSTRQERLSYELFSSQYTPQVVVLSMVFNDDLSYEEEVQQGYITTGSGPQLSTLWARLEAARQSTRRYDYTAAMREVRELNQACRRHGARLAVVIFRTSRHAEPWLTLVNTANEALKGTDIPFLDLGPALLDHLRDDRELWVHPGDGHPNERGHRIAAEQIARLLRSHSLLP